MTLFSPSEPVSDAAADEPWVDIGAPGDGNRIVYGRGVLRPQQQLLHVKVEAPVTVKHIIEAELDRRAELVSDV